VRQHAPLVAFSDTMRTQSTELKRFLFQNLYRHPVVTETTQQAKQVVRELFAAYMASPEEMQTAFANRADQVRSVADYIAGMTDRFAAREHQRLTGQRLIAADAP
jgi:dGTPase